MVEIRALRESGDRSRFHSGDSDLDRFFHKFAGQNQFKYWDQFDAMPQPASMFLAMRAGRRRMTSRCG